MDQMEWPYASQDCLMFLMLFKLSLFETPKMDIETKSETNSPCSMNPYMMYFLLG